LIEKHISAFTASEGDFEQAFRREMIE